MDQPAHRYGAGGRADGVRRTGPGEESGGGPEQQVHAPGPAAGSPRSTDLVDAGERQMDSFWTDQSGRSSVNGTRSLRGLTEAVIAFIPTWTSTKANLLTIAHRSPSMKDDRTEADGRHR